MQFVKDQWLRLSVDQRAQLITYRTSIANAAASLGQRGVPFSELDLKYAELKELLTRQRKFTAQLTAELADVEE